MINVKKYAEKLNLKQLKNITKFTNNEITLKVQNNSSEDEKRKIKTAERLKQ